ncbi:MAG TPA: hypothetical protein VH120_06060 [Gemmataceae bacterium]|nr:hypothetical protein [Gemmataceae bacterium]
MSTYSHVYPDGLAGMIEFAETGMKAGRAHNTATDPAGRASFIGREFRDWADVKAKLDEAWPDGLDEVQWMLFELRNVKLPTVTCQKRRPRFADEGDEIDNDRLRSGQEYWRTLRRESSTGPQTFVIVAAMTTPANRDSMDVLWRGAVAIVLADLLEDQGHRVELWACHRTGHAYKSGADNFQAVCLKHSEEPVDISTLTNAVSGWCYRTLWFTDMDAEPRSKTRAGLGHCRSVSQYDENVQAITSGANLIVIDNLWNKTAAVEFASRTLETINA